MTRAALAAYLVVVGVITLTPSAPGPTRGLAYWVITTLQRVLPLSWSQWEFLLNIAMFVPLGVLLAVVLGRRFFWLAPVVALATSLAIEGLQHVIPNRVPDVRDLFSNGMGGLIGMLVALAWWRISEKEKRRAQPS